MDDNSYLLELVGQTAENLIRKFGYCNCFGMYRTATGVNAYVMPDTIGKAGLDPNDRESFFEYIAKQVEPLEIVSAAIVVSAQIVPDPNQPPKDAIVVHMETKDAPATYFIRPYVVDGSDATFEEPFFQDSESRLLV